MPKFSWKMQSALKGDSQLFYRIGVSSCEDKLQKDIFDVWDSGKKMSQDNIGIAYEGDLLPRTKYQWKVFSWNTQDELAVSAPQYFETGKLKERFEANWISAPFIKKENDSYTAPYLRKRIKLKEMPISAKLYLCGLGYHEAYIEGEKISDCLLEPAFTKYDKTCYYSTYDLMPFISSCNFAIGVVLGNGWYNCFAQDPWNTRQATWRHFPKAIGELHFTYSDNSTEVIPTDTSWKTIKSPIVFNGIRNGEFYDARLEIPDWSNYSTDETAWESAVIIRSAGGELKASDIDPIRITQRLPAQKMWKNSDGNLIFDLGQNFAGIVKLIALGQTGQEIVLKYAEELTADKEHVNQSHIGSFIKSGEFQTDKYIKKSDFSEEWSPRFVYHGFRYVEVIGLPQNAGIDCITGLVMHTDFKQRGEFSCSDENLNKIQSLCYWSTISNFFSIPTDCPHREKNAWTGDAGISVEQTLINFDSVNAYLKWLDDISDSQRPSGMIPCVVPSTGWGYNWGNGPDWSNAIVSVIWYCYLYTSDKGILQKYLPLLEKHFDAMLSMSSNYIVNYGIGDWCAPFEGAAISANMSTFKAPCALTDTVFFYNTAKTLSKIYKILNKTSAYYENMSTDIRNAIVKNFVDTSTHIVSGDCQTSDGAILFNGIFEDDTQTFNHLLTKISQNSNHLDYGILGSKFVLNTLGEHKRADIIYEMLSVPTFPSYKHILSLGATTLYECWNGEGSHNHHMFSDVSAVMYKYFAGISVSEEHPGFREFKLCPTLFESLDFMNCSFDSPHGIISIRWKKLHKIVTLEINIPFGTTAYLTLPQIKSRLIKSGIHKFTFSQEGTEGNLTEL